MPALQSGGFRWHKIGFLTLPMRNAPAPRPPSARHPVSACPVCDGSRLSYQFSVEGFRIVRCHDCELMLTSPQPSDDELGHIYGEHYFLVENDAARPPARR